MPTDTSAIASSINTFDVIGLIIDAFVALIALIALVFSYRQIREFIKSRNKQYEQLRREKTVDIITYYSERINKETKYIENIVCNFTDEQCQDLYDCNPFIVDKRTIDKLCAICPNRDKCKSSFLNKEPCKGPGNTYYVRDNLLYHLRGNIISYLNTLEAVLLTWQLSITDQKIIQEQFAFLDKKRKKERALETIRMIAGGGKAYPAIEKFYQYLDRKAAEESKKTVKEIIEKD